MQMSSFVFLRIKTYSKGSQFCHQFNGKAASVVQLCQRTLGLPIQIPMCSFAFAQMAIKRNLNLNLKEINIMDSLPQNFTLIKKFS